MAKELEFFNNLLIMLMSVVVVRIQFFFLSSFSLSVKVQFGITLYTGIFSSCKQVR